MGIKLYNKGPNHNKNTWTSTLLREKSDHFCQNTFYSGRIYSVSLQMSTTIFFINTATYANQGDICA